MRLVYDDMANVGDIVMFGGWPHELEGPAVPCAWRLLELRANGTALLLCRDIIECRSYHDARGDVTWQNSCLRYWLNAVFFTRAFSVREQAQVQLEQCCAHDNDVFRTKGGGDTEDYVFCLSFDQVKRLLPSDEQRCAQPTPYARRNAGTSWWWLRDPGGHQFSCAAVAQTGRLDCNGFHASLDCIGVRPAIVVPLAALAQPGETLCGASSEGQDAAKAFHVGGEACAGGEAHVSGEAFVGREVLAGREAPRSDFSDQSAKLVEKITVATGVGIDFPHAGAALRYGDEACAMELLRKERLHAETATVAVSGGNPSIEAIHHLIDQEIFASSDLFQVCLAALRGKAFRLAARIISQDARRRAFDENHLRRLLKAAVEAGNVDLVELLLEKGATGMGYAAAYLKSGVSEEVARCVFAADPAGSLDHWDVLQTLPQALRFAVRRYCHQGESEQLVSLPGILAALARVGALDELRMVLATESDQSAFSRSDFSLAVASAKEAGYAAIVAFLLDRQAECVGSSPIDGSCVLRHPNLAL